MPTPGLNASVMAPKPSPAQTTKKQLTVFITIQVSPENIEKFKEAHRPVWKACSEEPECLFFDLFEDLDAPGRFRFVEVWSKGREWFNTEQMTKPYYKTMMEKSQPLWVKDIQVEYFEREGEAAVWSDAYLAGGKKMEKSTVVI